MNRHVVSEVIVNTKREAYISAFPFELNVFDDIRAFNEWAGFGQEGDKIEVVEADF